MRILDDAKPPEIQGFSLRATKTAGRAEPVASEIMKVALLIALVVLGGCASRESSSTDAHHRLPQVSCTLVTYHGEIKNICCEGERCWFTR